MGAEVVAAIVAAVAAIAAAGISAGSSKKTRETQVDLANTAHQREIEDLKKSHLNPILSAGGGQGAVTPNLQPTRIEGRSDIASSALALSQLKLQKQRTKAEVDKINQETSAIAQNQRTSKQQEYVNAALFNKLTNEAAVQDVIRKRTELENELLKFDTWKQEKMKKIYKGSAGDLLPWLDVIKGLPIPTKIGR